MARHLDFFGVVLGLIFLTIVAGLLSGGPILFPDSVGYFHAGFSAWSHVGAVFHKAHGLARGLVVEEQDGISTARSVYYGLVYVAAFAAGGQWALPIFQSIVCATALWLSIRKISTIGAWERSIIIILLALTTGLTVFCAAAMPDVFVGLMLLALAMLLKYSRVMKWAEYVFWLALVLAACLFHRGHVAVLAVALAACAFATFGRNARQIAIVAGVIVTAVIAHLTVEFVVKDMSGRWPIQTPFLLARLVGDGAAKPFLEQECPVRHYELCRFVDQMPMSENEFLWGVGAKSVMGNANKADRERIAAEAPSIEYGIIRAFPVREALATGRNVIGQFFDVGVFAYEQEPTLSQDRPVTPLHQAITKYLQRHVGHVAAFLRLESSMITTVYFVSLLGCLAVFTLQGRLLLEEMELQVVGILLIGLAANALVFGAVSGVFDRYQGRVAWLPALGLVMLMSRRRPAESVALSKNAAT